MTERSPNSKSCRFTPVSEFLSGPASSNRRAGLVGWYREFSQARPYLRDELGFFCTFKAKGERWSDGLQRNLIDDENGVFNARQLAKT